MRIVVCAKQVPNTNGAKIDPVEETLIRDGVESILNPDGANALEGALKLKDTYKDVIMTVIPMGPPQAEAMLRECLVMGADEVTLLSGREFGGSDTWATSNATSTAIKKIRDCDIIFGGRRATDGNTAQVGSQISEELDVPQVTYVQDFRLENGAVVVQRQTEDGYEVIRAETPYFLTAAKEPNKPRYMTMKGIYETYGEEITVWGFNDVDITQDKVGLKASLTRVFRPPISEPRGAGVVLGGSPKEQVAALMDSLKGKHIIQVNIGGKTWT